MTADRDAAPADGAWTRQPRDIVVLGSVVGRHVSPFSSMYGSTKFAVHSLAEALRREIGPKGVRVTLVEPAVVVSEFQQVAGYTDELVDGFNEKFGPLLVPSDIARSIAWVAAQPAHVHVSDIVVRATRQEYP
jgi:NADP-dependent 3-hydroxy acid dehydrogenase YdfG